MRGRHFLSVSLAMVTSLLLCAGTLHAIPAAPNGVSKVIAKVLKIEKRSRSATPNEVITFVQVDVYILEVDIFVDGERGNYAVGPASFILLYDEDISKLPFRAGSKIEGTAQFFGDEQFNGDLLSDVTVIAQDETAEDHKSPAHPKPLREGIPVEPSSPTKTGIMTFTVGIILFLAVFLYIRLRRRIH